MTIRFRLAIGFGLIIFAMVCITAFSLYQMGGIKQRVDSIVDVSSRKLILAQKLKTGILTVTVSEKNILLASDLASAKELILLVDRQSSSVSERIDALRALVESDQHSTLDQLSTYWANYRDITTKANDLATKETLKQAKQISQGIALQSFDKVLDHIADLQESNITALKQHRDTASLHEKLNLERTLLLGIESSLFGVQEAEQNLLYAKSQENIAQFIGEIENAELTISEQFSQLKANPIPINRKAFDLVDSSLHKYLRLSKEIRRLVNVNPKMKANALLSNEGEENLREVNRLLDVIISRNEFAMTQDQVQSSDAYNGTRQLVWIVLLVTGALCVLLSYILSQTITSPLRKLNQATQALASGDTSVRSAIDSNSEVGELAQAFNHMAEIIHQRVELQTGLNTLATSMRGDQSPNELAQNIINCVTGLLNFQLGAVYFSDSDTLQLIASYAFKFRSADQNTLKIGEGLVGQAALEQKAIVFSDIPEEHIDYRVQSGLGSSPVKNILVQPLLQSEHLIGVLVFGSCHDIDDDSVEFVNQANENIAIALDAAKTRAIQSELLEATQRQTEQLHEQQASLSKANQQLEEQTKNLQDSQERLESRGSELENLNTALESQTDQLHEQKAELERSKDLLEAKAEELDRASRYKSEFLANMSHELRSPLNSMLLLSKTLSRNEESNLNKEQIDSLKYIHSGGQELLSHINDILDLSKVEAGKLDFHFESVDTVMLCHDLELAYRPQILEKGIGFELEIEEGIPRFIKSDKKRIVQVLRNLISNAIKFTHTGKIVLGLFKPHDDISPKDGLLKQKNPLCFSVKDTGIGIPKDKCQAIFEAFQQADGSTSRKYGGTGLGLAISREFSKRLNGEIQLRSEKGEGSEFIFILPESADDSTVAIPDGTAAIYSEKDAESFKAPAQQSKPKNTLRGKIRPEPQAFEINVSDDKNAIDEHDRTMLIIEDDLGFAKILINHARTKGFKCIVAPTGTEGLAMAKQFRPTAITLDLGLPDLKGSEVLDALQEDPRTKRIPIHIISSYDDSPEMNDRSNEFLTKPVTSEDLEELFSLVDEVSQERPKEKKPGQAQGHQANAPRSKIQEDLDHQSVESNSDTPPKTSTKNTENSGKRVLLVDDDIRNMFALSQILKSAGMLVVKADNGELAVNRVKESLVKKVPIDIVLMDIMMPVMDGYEAIKQIRQLGEQSQMPIIALTAKAMAGDREKCIEAGADDYLTKPIEESKLIQLLNKWLSQSKTKPAEE